MARYRILTQIHAFQRLLSLEIKNLVPRKALFANDRSNPVISISINSTVSG